VVGEGEGVLQEEDSEVVVVIVNIELRMDLYSLNLYLLIRFWFIF